MYADNREQLERILELDNEETIQVNFTSLSESVLEKLYEQRNEFTGPVPKLFDSTHVIMCKNKKEIVFIKKYDFRLCSRMWTGLLQTSVVKNVFLKPRLSVSIGRMNGRMERFLQST